MWNRRFVFVLLAFVLLIMPSAVYGQDVPPADPPVVEVPVDSPPIVALSLEEIIMLVAVFVLVIFVVLQRKDIGYLNEWRRENRARMEQLERGYATAPEASRQLIDTLATVADALDEFVPQLESVTDFLRDIQKEGVLESEGSTAFPTGTTMGYWTPTVSGSAGKTTVYPPRPDTNTD